MSQPLVRTAAKVALKLFGPASSTPLFKKKHYMECTTRMDGMANPGERSINVVNENKPKVLEGLSQKGTVAGTRTLPFLVMGSNATGG